MVELVCKACGAKAALDIKYLKEHNFCSKCGTSKFRAIPESKAEKKMLKGKRIWMGVKIRLPMKGLKKLKFEGIYWPEDFIKLPKKTIILVKKGILIRWSKKKR
jgi:hypothetical protein